MVDDAVPDLHRRTQEAVQMARDEDFAGAIEIFETALPRLTGGDLSDKRMAAAAFSYYGLCMAMVRRKYSQAVDFCNISLKANFMDPDHRYNLAMVYLERGDRRKAVETLNAGLRLEPRNRRLNSMLDEIGRRRPPVIGFLARDNPVNVWLGKMRHKGSSTK